MTSLPAGQPIRSGNGSGDRTSVLPRGKAWRMATWIVPTGPRERRLHAVSSRPASASGPKREAPSRNGPLAISPLRPRPRLLYNAAIPLARLGVRAAGCRGPRRRRSVDLARVTEEARGEHRAGEAAPARSSRSPGHERCRAVVPPVQRGAAPERQWTMRCRSRRRRRRRAAIPALTRCARRSHRPRGVRVGMTAKPVRANPFGSVRHAMR